MASSDTESEESKMSVSEHTISNLVVASWVWINKLDASTDTATATIPTAQPAKRSFDFLRPLRRWIDDLEVHSPQFAHSVCKRIPSQCPFERDVNLFGRTLFHIPPLCKLNPVYDEVVGLRFRALCYLADECGEDVTPYC